MDTVLTATQIEAYCTQISSFSKCSASKLALVGSLHKEVKEEGEEGTK